ncbi:MAG: penicillin-binding transpeptidase domain-containing protein [Defluviitaleaceae bacterium]|nr:penicillin-binding transpeptidase domain-containing protein [Defluviitaleaceae bacterium]
MEKKSLKDFLNILNNRLLIFFLASSLTFLFLTNVLFNLQIVQGEEFYNNLLVRIPRKVYIPAQRGNIYDRFGRPLALNIRTNSIMFDPSINLTNAEINEVLFNILKLIEENDEDFFDVLPITKTENFEFTFSDANLGRQRARFFSDIEVEDTFEVDDYGNIISEGISVEELFDILRARFFLNDLIERENLNKMQIRNLISMRINLFYRRFRLYEPITFALNVGMDTITRIREEIDRFRGAFIGEDFLREYPAGRYLSHVVGYIGNIREVDDLPSLIEQGYSPTDLIGHTGIERAFESELRGRPGHSWIYTNTLGRRLGTFYDEGKDVIHGSDIFLTIDKFLQSSVFRIVEDVLTRTIINRMTVNHNREELLTVEHVLASLVAANNINPRLIFESNQDTISYIVKNYVLEINPYASISTRIERNEINQIIANGIRERDLTPNQILVLMYEQDIITGDENFVNRVLSGNSFTARNIVIEKLNSGEITPQMTNVDPSTASVVVVDVNTGEILAAVSYPTFDSNQLVNNVNNEYFLNLLNDPTSPMFNRAFQERRAPGSTFKMLTGIAALEEGVITQNTRITDRPEFTRAGTPHPRSWSSVSLGSLNYAEALAISSNYFFYESAFRLGDRGTGNAATLGIEALNRYMRAFGFDSPTGVEIGEASRADIVQISSPEIQDRIWTHGDTVRTAIGQHLNSYTALTMARFTQVIASRGNMVELRLLDRIVGEDLTYIARTRPVDMGINISDSTWDQTHLGMRLVTESSRATATGLFNSFPFSVGSKTGTAEEHGNRLSHTTFNAFAPFDDPQIALYVIVPFGATATTSPSPSSQIARYIIAEYFRLNDTIDENNSSYVLLR